MKCLFCFILIIPFFFSCVSAPYEEQGAQLSSNYAYVVGIFSKMQKTEEEPGYIHFISRKDGKYIKVQFRADSSVTLVKLKPGQYDIKVYSDITDSGITFPMEVFLPDNIPSVLDINAGEIFYVGQFILEPVVNNDKEFVSLSYGDPLPDVESVLRDKYIIPDSMNINLNERIVVKKESPQFFFNFGKIEYPLFISNETRHDESWYPYTSSNTSYSRYFTGKLDEPVTLQIWNKSLELEAGTELKFTYSQKIIQLLAIRLVLNFDITINNTNVGFKRGTMILLDKDNVAGTASSTIVFHVYGREVLCPEDSLFRFEGENLRGLKITTPAPIKVKSHTLLCKGNFHIFGNGESISFGIAESVSVKSGNTLMVIPPESIVALDKDNFYSIYVRENMKMTVDGKQMTADADCTVFFDENGDFSEVDCMK